MPPEQQQPGQGLDPSKLGERLAQRELEAMQGPVKAPEVNPDSARLAEYSQKKAAIEAELEKKKAELLTPAVESKTAKSNTSNTPPELQHLVGRNINEITAAPEPPKSSGPIDKIKDFFSKISAGFAAFFKKFTDKIGEFTTKIKEKFTGKKSTPDSTVKTTPERTGSGPEAWKPVVEEEAKRLGIEPAFAYAIVTVEAGKKGINDDGSTVIRFEPHVFNSQLSAKGINQKHGKWGSSTLSGRNVDGVSCEGGQANEHACLKKAMEINKDAALRSISMGMGQIMGFNHNLSGYSSAEEMYNKFSKNAGGEAEQIRAMFKLIENTKPILNAARRKDFGAFTSAYNGSKPGSDLYNRYVNGMRNAYAKNGGTGQSANA